MIRKEPNSRFLLFIQPDMSQRNQIAIEDEYTDLLRRAMRVAEMGTSNYKEIGVGLEPVFNKGKHYPPMLGIPAGYVCCDGTKSRNVDFLLPCGFITHGLAVHYMCYFRKAISVDEWNKIKELQRNFGRTTVDVNNFKI